MRYREGPERVLYIEHWPYTGGGQRALEALVTGLGERPEAVVVLPPGSRLFDWGGRFGGRRVEMRMPGWRRAGGPGEYVAVALGAPGPWWRLYRLMGREGIDLVHANGLFALLTALVPARLRRLPVVGHIHSFDGLDHRAAGWALRRTSAVVTVCEAMAGEILSRWGPTVDLETVHNGIDIKLVESEAGRERPDISADRPVIGTVTTFHPDKGFEFLLRALKRVGPAVDFELVVLGDGPGRAGAEALAGELGLGGRVRWLGYRANPYPYISRFDLYAGPSLVEASPMSLLEAMALRVPVLATAVGGVPEMIEHGVSGWLVPPSDPEAMAAAIETLLGDVDRRRRLASAGRERVEARFTAERMAGDFRRIYSSLIDGD